MFTLSRNLVVVSLAFVAALLFATLGQRALSYFLPAFSARPVGGTDIATLALLVSLAVAFLIVGLLVPRWLKTIRPLLWLSFPLVAVCLVAIVAQPEIYRCNPLNTTSAVSCSVILSPFVVSIAALVVGCLFRRSLGSVVHAV